MFPTLVLAPLLQHKGRLLVSVLAIAIGVALGLAVQLINAAAVAEFGLAARQIAGEADLTVRAARAGLDERLYAELAAHPEVAVASPALEIDAKLVGRDETLHVLAIDVFRAGQLQPSLIGEAQDGLDTLRADAVFLARAAAARLGLAPGDRIRVQVGLESRELRVAGLLAGEGARADLAVMDIAAAQRMFERFGRLSRLDLRLRPGADPDAVARGLRLPPGVVAERPQQAGETTARMTRAYRVNLNVLALVALFTGGLLVFSTQALSVARRRAQLALLRVIGFTRRQVVGLLVAEGAVVGTLGAAIGFAGGLALAHGALSFTGADLGAGFFRGVQPVLHVDPLAAGIFVALGIGAALAGSLGPAFEAARAAPAQALKQGDDARAFAALRPAWPGVLCLGLGVACAFLPPVRGLPLFGYLAIALLLVGTILLMPRATSLLLARLPRGRRVTAELALSRLQAYPTQAAVSLAAIVAAVSLMVAMAVMVTSFRNSLDDWLRGILPADLYLRAGGQGDSAYLSTTDQARLREVPGVDRVEFLRWQHVLLVAGEPRVTLLARDGVGRDAERRLPLVGAVAPAIEGVPRVWVSEAAAALFTLEPGRRLAVPLGGQAVGFQVAGVWRDYARQNGALLIDRATYRQLTGDDLANDAGIWLAAGASVTDVRAALEALAPGGVELLTPGEVREISLTVFDRTFAVTYALEAAAILIGLMGLSSAIGAEVVARRKEFGMLRHLGVTQRQIAGMLAAEGGAIGAVGVLVGGLLGFAMSLILVFVVNRQSFHWGMDLHVPWAPLIAFAAAMVALAAGTAALGGRQALGGDVVRAVREDW